MSKEENETILVKIRDGIPLEKAIKKFKRLCDAYGILREYRKREAHAKPSVRAKEKRESAEKRKLKAARQPNFKPKKDI